MKLPMRFICIVFVVFLQGCKDHSATDEHPLPNQSRMLQQLDRPFDSHSEEIKQLEALGYLGGHETPDGPSGVLHYDREKAFDGYNLIVSGHGPEVCLKSMDGSLIHTWRCPRNQAIPGSSEHERDSRSKSFRRAYALSNGDLLGIFNGTGMVRLNRNSDILWVQQAMCHHDLTFGPDGTIFTFVQKTRIFRDFNAESAIFDEFVVEMNPENGEIIREMSLIEAFHGSVFSSWLKKIPVAGDIFHANTIEYIGSEKAGLQPIYQPDSLLISLRNMDAVLIMNAGTGKIEWVMAGLWSFQHESSILPNGNLLVFDNTGHAERSKVVEINPITQSVVWSYADSPSTPLFSSTSGACHRLPNGNTLIIESNKGRAFEVLPDHTCVWDYINPERWGEGDRMRATLFDIQRLPDGFFTVDFNYTPNNRNSGMSHTR